MRVTFSKECKIEAVRLLDLGKKSAVELALELGVRRNQLYKWKEQLSQKKEAAFRGP
ncbi:MAG: transposase, partial [Pseudomonadota bacterium]